MGKRGALAAAACCTLLLPSASALPQGWDRHTPHPSAVVVSGHARFTVIHDSIIRMEYDAGPEAGDGGGGGAAAANPLFDDRPTINFADRRPFPVPLFTVSRGAGDDGRGSMGLTITTSALVLHWSGGIAAAAEAAAAGAPPSFTPSTLSVTLRHAPFTRWSFGDSSFENLGGAIRTLDRASEALNLTCTPPQSTMEFYAHCEAGLASRAGWVVVDESVRPRVQLSRSEGRDAGNHFLDDWPWPVAPSEANLAVLQGKSRARAASSGLPYTDLVFFGFGLDHAAAVSAYTRMAGPIPHIPRYALGTGFSRWFAYNQLEEREGAAGPGAQGGIISSFEAWGVPLDLLSIDMDWHTTSPRGERNSPLSGEKNDGWTGWSWEKHLWPAPSAFMSAARRKGVHVNLNQHPAGGITFDEDAYPAAARAVGIDPRTLAKIEFEPANQSYVSALLQHVLKPLDDTGMSFWWQDYQHGPYSSVPLLNPTYLTNLYLWENPWRYGPRSGKIVPALPASGRAGAEDDGAPTQLVAGDGSGYVDRPLLFGRWSGLGSHRMPIGFAGDTAVKWRVLRYEAYFSATASNAAFCWSNDIGGFEGAPAPELMVRWSQYGALSAMLRGHSSKMSPPRTAWTFGFPHFGAVRQAWRLRAALLPYLAAAQRTSHETGLQLMQPTYWHYPANPASFTTQGQHQYFFGPGQAIWAAPVSSPAILDGTEDEARMTLMERVEAERSGNPRPLDAVLAQHAGRVPWTFWAPPGAWIEWGSWQAVRGKAPDAPSTPASPFPSSGGSFIARNYSLSEIPMFSPPGAVIPMRVLPGTGSASKGREHPNSVLGLATHPLTDLALWVMPLAPPTDLYDDSGAAPSSSSSSSTVTYGPSATPPGGFFAGAQGVMGPAAGKLTSRARIYEDDGLTQAAADGFFYDSAAECSWERKSTAAAAAAAAAKAGGGEPEAEDTLSCSLLEPTGRGYPGHPASRAVTWRFIGVWPPSSIEVDGVVLPPTARDQAAIPDNHGEHGAWEAEPFPAPPPRRSFPSSDDVPPSSPSSSSHSYKTVWGYHGPSTSVWLRVGGGVPTTPPSSTARAGVGADGSSFTSSSAFSFSAAAPLHTVKLRFHAGARLDDPLLTRYGVHRVVSRSLLCKEEVDRAYSFVYPSDVPDVLNVSARAVLLGESSTAKDAAELIRGIADSARAGADAVSRWSIPPGSRIGGSLQQHCIGALRDAMQPPRALAADDPRALHASRALSFSAGISETLGSAPGEVSQHEGGGGADADADEWEGKGWTLLPGGSSVPPPKRK